MAQIFLILLGLLIAAPYLIHGDLGPGWGDPDAGCQGRRLTAGGCLAFLLPKNAKLGSDRTSTS